jgi:hypothetical protein
VDLLEHRHTMNRPPSVQLASSRLLSFERVKREIFVLSPRSPSLCIAAAKRIAVGRCDAAALRLDQKHRPKGKPT